MLFEDALYATRNMDFAAGRFGSSIVVALCEGEGVRSMVGWWLEQVVFSSFVLLFIVKLKSMCELHVLMYL